MQLNYGLAGLILRGFISLSVANTRAPTTLIHSLALSFCLARALIERYGREDKYNLLEERVRASSGLTRGGWLVGWWVNILVHSSVVVAVGHSHNAVVGLFRQSVGGGGISVMGA